MNESSTSNVFPLLELGHSSGGIDYVGVFLEQLVFSSAHCISITILNDTVFEGNETFLVFLETSNMFLDISQSVVTVTILDNSGKHALHPLSVTTA